MDDLFSPRGLSGRMLARSDLASLAGGAPQVVVDCDLEEADVAGLDLTGWRFERCNLRKADLLPHIVGMRPRRAPYAPSVHDLHQNGRLFPPNYLHESWLDYLYWDSELEP